MNRKYVSVFLPPLQCINWF